VAASWVACRLPEPPLLALADLGGQLWYRLAPERRSRARRSVVPSETVADPDLQRYIVSTRRRLGLELIELSGAKRLLKEALQRGETVGLLGDRDITGGGIDVELFGAPAPLAAGPALLALETGVTPHVFGVWRDARGVFHARAELVPFPAEGTRRERVTAYLEAEARAFERHIAAAPEQWLAVFHPIWPDLEQAQTGTARKRLAAAVREAAS
jgi:lauroyl/myristoyl acyltransferase